MLFPRFYVILVSIIFAQLVFANKITVEHESSMNSTCSKQKMPISQHAVNTFMLEDE